MSASQVKQVHNYIEQLNVLDKHVVTKQLVYLPKAIRSGFLILKAVIPTLARVMGFRGICNVLDQPLYI